MFSKSNPTKSKFIDSRRFSISLDDLRRKSSIKRVNKERTNSFSMGECNKNYLQCQEYIIVPNSELPNIKDKKCRDFDVYNENIYKKNLKLYCNIQNKIANSIFELKSSPTSLPNPNNYQRLMLYRKRNASQNCLYQTSAIIYLLKNGYILVNDLHNINTITLDNKMVYFEAYQAIEYAKELSHIRGEHFLNIQDNFNKLCIKQINNDTSNDNDNDDNNNNDNEMNNYINVRPNCVSDNNVINIDPSNITGFTNVYPTLDMANINYANNNGLPLLESEHMMQVKQIYCTKQPTSSIHNRPLTPIPSAPMACPVPITNLKCSIPEHHTIDDKVVHFDKLENKLK